MRASFGEPVCSMSFCQGSLTWTLVQIGDLTVQSFSIDAHVTALLGGVGVGLFFEGILETLSLYFILYS
jgi:hypothetical protein